MKLTNPTDYELNVTFAIQIAGWSWAKSGGYFLVDPQDGLIRNPPNFIESADALLPWLEKCMEVTIAPVVLLKGGLGRYVRIDRDYCGEADSIPHASVIALLRANGVEVEFTK